MTTSHYKPGGNSKARRRRIRALEEVWGEFVDHWFMLAKFRGCDYIQVAVAPHGVIANGELDRSLFLKQLHDYGDQSIKTFQASTEILSPFREKFLCVRLQRPGYRQDGSRDLGVREEAESEASQKGPGTGTKIVAPLGLGQRHQEVRAFTEGGSFNSW